MTATPKTAPARRRRKTQPAGPPDIHIFNPLWDASGGSEWSAIELYRELKKTGKGSVQLWSEAKVDPYFSQRFPVRKVRFPFRFPRTGTFLIVGAYFDFGLWFAWARPTRTILRFNTPEVDALRHRLKLLSLNGLRRVEMVYPSELTAKAAGIPGRVDPVPLDLERFSPREDHSYARPGSFVVGRLSRDVPEKHHQDDPALYQRLVAEGGRVRLLGGTCLKEKIGGRPGIELLPACSESAEGFLRNLDCFFYRTDPIWLEPFGRVVAEAMACGIPVVCERRGGFTEWVRHGENGFLFDSPEEGWDQLMRLKADPELRERIGRAARRTLEEVFDPGNRGPILDYYLQR